MNVVAAETPVKVLETVESGTPMPAYRFGDYVYYLLRGVERVGRVTFIFTTGKNEPAYHVVDDDGYYWHRSRRELSLVNTSQPIAA